MTRGQERGRWHGRGQIFLKKDVEAPPIGELKKKTDYHSKDEERGRGC